MIALLWAESFFVSSLSLLLVNFPLLRCGVGVALTPCCWIIMLSSRWSRSISRSSSAASRCFSRSSATRCSRRLSSSSASMLCSSWTGRIKKREIKIVSIFSGRFFFSPEHYSTQFSHVYLWFLIRKLDGNYCSLPETNQNQLGLISRLSIMVYSHSSEFGAPVIPNFF